MNSMKKRLLVTGGAGFIGSNFVNYVVEHYPECSINVYDKLTYAGNINNLAECFLDARKSQYTFTEACVMNRDKMCEAIINSDIIIHFACESHVSNSLAQADEFINTNVFGTMVLCEEVAKYPVEKFLLISSSEVYGTAVAKPMDEQHPLNPASPYAASKAGQDRVAFSYYYGFDIPVTIIRPFNQYGPCQHIEKAIPMFITNLLQNKKISIHNNGMQTRDWLYVDDLCLALDKVIHCDNEDVIGETINIGSGKETSVINITTKICELLGKDVDEFVEFGMNRKGQVMSHISSTTKAKKLLNWEPVVDIDEGLERTVEWYRNNESWWRSLRFPILKVPERFRVHSGMLS
jgi:dTDP-glucose 4,6-dehydratase